jgi:molecular chaperone Hsp33
MPRRASSPGAWTPGRISQIDSQGEVGDQELLGEGHMAMTVDQGAQARRYQGVVPLDGRSLEDAAHLYFRQSEQIPTRVRLAAARAFKGGEQGLRWRAGGIVIQHLPEAGPRRPADLPPGDAPAGNDDIPLDEPDEWTEARLLLDTVANDELTDPSIPAGELLMRLYHERGVRVFAPHAVTDECRCSRAGIVDMLARFSPEEQAEMVKDGKITVTCEFCSTRYEVDPQEVSGE